MNAAAPQPSELGRGRPDWSEEECAQLALEIHDGPLALLNYLLSHGRLQPEDQSLLGEAVDELQALLGSLHLPLIDQLGLLPALEWLIDREQSLGLSAQLSFGGEPNARLPGPVEWAAFRIGQQALTNVRKHAFGAAARIRLELAASRLILEITDEGPGLPLQTEALALRAGRRGLAGMRGRAESIGGRLLIDGSAGTLVRLEWAA